MDVGKRLKKEPSPSKKFLKKGRKKGNSGNFSLEIERLV